MRWMGRATGVAAAAAVAVGIALVPPGAGAHTAKFESRITIKSPSDYFYRGRVFSDRDKCEPGRKVKMFRADGSFVGATETNAAGAWEFHFVGEQYYVTVTRRVDGSGAHRHVCLGDRSRTTY